MQSTRRTFLKTGTQLGAAGMVLGAIPRPLLAHFGARPEAVPPIEDPRIKALAEHAIDAARSAGAGYADIILRHTSTRLTNSGGGITDLESMQIGVRALVNGYWGFASSPVWSRDDVVRLAQSATQQAATSARGKARLAELAPTPVVKDQHWTMPVVTDPFTVHPDEISDYLSSLRWYAERRAKAAGLGFKPDNDVVIFTVQQKAVATTEGTFCTQRLYRTSGNYPFSFTKTRAGELPFKLMSISPAGAGWELFRDQPLRAEIDGYIEEALQDFELPLKPVDVGRYDVVLDAFSLANAVSPTLGLATELDRALGYEANASGTSYLQEPMEMLGLYKVGAPLLNVTANRTDPGAVATVRWDDEGVAPLPFPLVQNGVLVNYSSTREGAGWLKEYYAKNGTPLRSHGCAIAGDDWFGGMYAPIAQTPNLVVTPSADAADFETLISDVTNGLAWKNMQFDMDFQQLSGLGTGKTYDIRNGKRVARVSNAGIIFQAPELYKSLMRLGGAASARRYGIEVVKGMPPQKAYHSVSAVPATLKDITIFDVSRKA